MLTNVLYRKLETAAIGNCHLRPPSRQ